MLTPPKWLLLQCQMIKNIRKVFSIQICGPLSSVLLPLQQHQEILFRENVILVIISALFLLYSACTLNSCIKILGRNSCLSLLISSCYPLEPPTCHFCRYVFLALYSRQEYTIPINFYCTERFNFEGTMFLSSFHENFCNQITYYIFLQKSLLKNVFPQAQHMMPAEYKKLKGNSDVICKP